MAMVIRNHIEGLGGPRRTSRRFLFSMAKLSTLKHLQDCLVSQESCPSRYYCPERGEERRLSIRG